MKLIRNKVFETNSSSAHSLTISHGEVYDSLFVDEDGVCRVDCGGYSFCRGSGRRTNSTEEKIAFFATLGDAWNDDLLEDLKEQIQSNTGCDRVELLNLGESDYEFCSDFDLPSGRELYDAIFDRNSWLFILGDEYEEPDGFYDVPKYE